MKEDARSIPQCLERALLVTERFFPYEAELMERTLDKVLLGSISENRKANAWNGSSLTRGGFPLEFAFTFPESGIRYTTEVNPPSNDKHDCLMLANDFILGLGSVELPEEMISSLKKIQDRSYLKFGTWLGCRHSREKTVHKLYIEVPHSGWDESIRYFKQEASCSMNLDDMGRPCMIGICPSSRSSELYFRRPRLDPSDIFSIMIRMGMKYDYHDFLGAIEESYGRPIYWKLPGEDYGISISLIDGEPLTFSVFAFPEILFGSSSQTRKALISFAERNGLSYQYYAAFSEPLINDRDGKNAHGIIAFSMTKGEPPGICIGLGPPRPLSGVT
ncbi:MAG: hypothetical protein WAW52_00050 [Methanothrix sp.]